MSDEFDLFKKNIQAITEQNFNTNNSLIGNIVDYNPNMEYCDVEVELNGGKFTFTNVPAHGFPVKGSSAIIHFHNGNLEQPVCDCAYRLNPPNHTLKEYYTNDCFNWCNNGDFQQDKKGFQGTYTLIPESYLPGGTQSAMLAKEGDYLEFKAYIGKCTTEYFKFQCYYKGQNKLIIECFDEDTGEIIQNLPYTMSFPYKIWDSPYGRYNWAYNKEVYPYLTRDGITHNNIRIRITNFDDTNETMTYNGETISTPSAMLLDGLLVYSECDDQNYYNSEQDMITLHNLK